MVFSKKQVRFSMADKHCLVTGGYSTCRVSTNIDLLGAQEAQRGSEPRQCLSGFPSDWSGTTRQASGSFSVRLTLSHAPLIRLCLDVQEEHRVSD